MSHHQGFIVTKEKLITSTYTCQCFLKRERKSGNQKHCRHSGNSEPLQKGGLKLAYGNSVCCARRSMRGHTLLQQTMVVSFSSCHTQQYCYLTWLIEFFKNIKSGRLFSSLIAMIRSTNSFIFLFGVIQLFLHISIHYVYSKELEEECYLFTMDGSIE